MLLPLAFLAGCIGGTAERVEPVGPIEQLLVNKLSCDGLADPRNWWGIGRSEPFEPASFFCEQAAPRGKTPILICYAYGKDKVAVVEYLYESETSKRNYRGKIEIIRSYSLVRASVGRVVGIEGKPADLVEVIACD